MSEPTDSLKLLGLKEAARVLGTDHREVREWVERGLLPCVRVGVTQEPRVSPAMLLAWQEGRIGALSTGQITAKSRRTRAPLAPPEPPSLRLEGGGKSG